MTKITIGFSRPKTWKPFAALIMLGYDIPFSHVYIRFHSDKYNRDLTYQASGTALNFMGPIVFNEHNKVVDEFEVDISDESHVAMVQFAIDVCGRPYGIKEACGLAIVRIAELFGKKIQNPFRDGEASFVCSVLGAFILENFTDIGLTGDPEDINPKELHTFMQSIRARSYIT